VHLHDGARRRLKIKFDEARDNPTEVHGDVLYLSGKDIKAGRQLPGMSVDDILKEHLGHAGDG
jgi:hypothetical protein